MLDKGIYINFFQVLLGFVFGLKVFFILGNLILFFKIILCGGINFDGFGGFLVVVDGQFCDNFDDINFQDIVFMDVLKDVGVIVIYGVCVSNGVILIMIKLGKVGYWEINFRVNVGFGYVNNFYDFLGVEDYIIVFCIVYKNILWVFQVSLIGFIVLGMGNQIGLKMVWNIMGKIDVNVYFLDKGWCEMLDFLDFFKIIIYKEIKLEEYNFCNLVVMQDYIVSMFGGNDRGIYYVSLGYNDFLGVFIIIEYICYNFIFNGLYKIVDWLKMIFNVIFSCVNYVWLNNDWGMEVDYFGCVMSFFFIVCFEDEDGNLMLGLFLGDGNQIYVVRSYDQDNEWIKLIFMQFVEVNLFKGLVLRVFVSWYYFYIVEENMCKDYEMVLG